MDDEDLLDKIAALFEKSEVYKSGNDIIILGILTDEEVLYFDTIVRKKLIGFKKVIRFSETRHIALAHGKSHEKLNNQKQIITEHFIQIPNIIINHDSIHFQPKDHINNKRFDSILFIRGKYSVVLEIVFGNKELRLKTMWVKK